MDNSQVEENDRLAWSVPEAARQIGVSKALLWREISLSRGPKVRYIGLRRTIILKTDLLAWLEERAATPSITSKQGVVK